MQLSLQHWPGPTQPTAAAMRQILAKEGLSAYRWSNGPGDEYATHTHNFHKVLYVINGSITFNMPQLARQVTLRAGDRLELPAGVAHSAVVGREGVACLEAHLP